jgi:mRNA-degrading endonuclease toxin of MazEF toxin-antitoxin module
MIQPGEIYEADVPPGQRHRVVVVSREELNRGNYVVAALITSKKFAVRSVLPNCVPLKAGQFTMTQDSVVQGRAPGRSGWCGWACPRALWRNWTTSPSGT